MSPDNAVDQDAGNPQSWNLYPYVKNNPVTNTDSDGRAVNVCDASAQNCHVIWDDQAYANAQEQDKQLNGPSLSQLQNSGQSMSITDSGGNVVGTAKSVPENPGIEGPASAAAFGQIGNQGMGAIEWFGEQMAWNAAGGLAGHGIGLAVDAFQASRAAGAIAEVLVKAGSAVGNTGMKVASREVAEQAAKEWVGEGARTIYANRGAGEPIGEVSADGTKVVRFNNADKKGYINLESRTTGSNLHVRW